MSTKFKGLKFKIHDLPKDKKVLEAFPELKSYKAISKCKYPDIDKVLRYVIYLYDPNTDPIIKDIPDLLSKKKAAASFAGFAPETPELESIFQFKEPQVVDIVQWYLTEIHFNRYYREWCTLKQELDDNNRLRLTPANEDDESDSKSKNRSNLRKEAYEIHDKLDIIERKIFSGDEALQLIAEKSRFKSPEAWSEILMVE